MTDAAMRGFCPPSTCGLRAAALSISVILPLDLQYDQYSISLV